MNITPEAVVQKCQEALFEAGQYTIVGGVCVGLLTDGAAGSILQSFGNVAAANLAMCEACDNGLMAYDDDRELFVVVWSVK